MESLYSMTGQISIEKFNRHSEQKISFRLTFPSVLIIKVLETTLKKDIFPPTSSAILELEITISIIRMNESLSLKANIIKQIARNLMTLRFGFHSGL